MESRKSGTKDHYITLGVGPEATTSEIKKAYRALAQRFHPDHVQGQETITASEKMILINEAFSVLSDERRREAFDRELLLERNPTQIPLATPPASNDWEIPVAPMSRPGAGKPRQNLDVDKSISQDFFEKIKLQVMQAGESAKMKDESEPGWVWSLQGKTWGGNYWVALRIFPVLNPNITRELLKQINALMSKRRSGWKNNAFVFCAGI